MFTIRCNSYPVERVVCERVDEAAPRYSGIRRLYAIDPISGMFVGFRDEITTFAPLVFRLRVLHDALRQLVGRRYLGEFFQNENRISEYYVQNMIASCIVPNRSRENRIDYDIAKIRFLISDLTKLRDAKPKLYEILRKNVGVARAKNRSHYYGPRYELALATMFVYRTIKFEKPTREDEGDFVVDHVDGPIIVEATCPSVTGKEPGSTDFTYKIQNAISEKSLKLYSTTKNVLFVDCSQAAMHQVPFHIPNKAGVASLFWSRNHDSCWMREAVNDSGFGSIILTHFVVIDDDPFLEPEFDIVYRRYDHPEMDPRLKVFLDQHFGCCSPYLCGHTLASADA